MKSNKCQNKGKEEKDVKGKDKKISQKNITELWMSLTPAENRKRYMESIPAQVSAAMAFEGEHVSLRMPKEYLKEMRRGKNI